MTNKERFIEIYQTKIHRDGADKLLEFLLSRHSDFFEAPASARYHGAYAGGLCEHSLNVYDCLKAYLERDRAREVYGLNYSEETVAIVSLLHDICKINVYEVGVRNKKDENGKWIQVPVYEFNDKIPYGHGEKSVMMLTEYMKLTNEEKYAIRWHMGFTEPKENYTTIGLAYKKYPIALLLNESDLEASYFFNV